MAESFLDSTLFTWVILPVLIFLARIIDVPIGTLRIIFMARGNLNLVPILGFFEVLIWMMAIRTIFNNLNNIACYIAFAGGFAVGNYVGMQLERKLALGFLSVRVFVQQGARQLAKYLGKHCFGVTVVDGHGINGGVDVIFAIIQRKELQSVIAIIKRFEPQSFYSVEDVRCASVSGTARNGLKPSKRFIALSKKERKSK